MKTVIIIPTFNERDNIGKLINKIIFVSKKIKKWRIDILVVDDNSPDGTSEVVKKRSKRNKSIHLLVRKKKVGLGAAYLAGMKYAFERMHAQVVVIMDADLSHNPSYLPQFLRKISDGADFVIGSRYIPGGSIAKEWGLHRKILSVFGNKVVFLLLRKDDLTDWTSGYRALRREVYKKVTPFISEDKAEFRGYTFNISFAYHALKEGFKNAEVPIKFVDRKNGKSKLGFEYLYYTPIFLFKTRLKEILGI